MKRKGIFELIDRLCKAQLSLSEKVLNNVRLEDLKNKVRDNEFMVQDILRMWVWHFWTHNRDLVRASGALKNDNPHFHVPHFVRQANEEFGRFIGELACLNDEQLELEVPDGERSVPC